MGEELKSKVDDISILTPHNEALYEAGKTLLVESITVSREFCKFMITLSTSAIPVHLGLLKFVIPDHYVLSSNQGTFAAIPAFLFLISSIIFTVGLYPQIGNLSLDIPSEIEKERKKTLQSRKRFTFLGFVIFCTAVFLMIVCSVYYLTTV
ncbi:MAG: hypothetical protein JWN78_2254 [Bacteroidota bacterium]|nr:hypothetical protein [Bacteroidota bacterium]